MKKSRKRTWLQKKKTNMNTKVRRVREPFGKATAFGVIVWAAWIIDLVCFPVEFKDYGLIPRTAKGLIGIVTQPFIHGGFSHIFNNTIGLWFLLSVLFISHKLENSKQVLVQLIVLAGSLLWLFGRGGQGNIQIVHVGASGLVYALAVYTVVMGFRHKNILLIAISVIVLAQHGAGLVSGIVPSNNGVSWDGHLAGAVAGAIVAFSNERKGLRTSLNQR